jgi:hypothetical protein
MSNKDVLFEIQSGSEVKERACYVQNFLVWDRLNVVQIECSADYSVCLSFLLQGDS